MLSQRIRQYLEDSFNWWQAESLLEERVEVLAALVAQGIEKGKDQKDEVLVKYWLEDRVSGDDKLLDPAWNPSFGIIEVWSELRSFRGFAKIYEEVARRRSEGENIEKSDQVVESSN